MSLNLNIWGILDESNIDGAECSRKVVSRRGAAGAIRSLVNGRDLQLESCMRLIVPVLMYGSEKMLWKEERSRVRAVQMYNLKGIKGKFSVFLLFLSFTSLLL